MPLFRPRNPSLPPFPRRENLPTKTTENIIRKPRARDKRERCMGDLKSFCRSFWSLWLRATCSAKHGGRLTWNHLRQRMSFLCYHRLPSTAPPRKKKNCEPPSKLWSAHTWLSHYPASAPYPHTPNQRYRDEKALLIKKKKKKERKEKAALREDGSRAIASTCPILGWQICWQTGHLEGAGPWSVSHLEAV